ncbi:MAG: hypothetical protein ACOY94_02325 [Bacillota bacterium]
MTEKVTRAGWQQLATELLELYRGELARHGISLGPDLHLEADESTPYSYCDLATGRISLNLPGTDRFADLLVIMAVGGLLGTRGMDEALRALRALQPYLLGHELAHYLRERFGAFTPNHWVEEHVANRLGMALACTVPAFTAELDFLRRLAEGARERLPLREDQVVGALRETHAAAVEEVLAFAELTGADELEALRAAGLEAEVAALSDRRDRSATAFNESYLTDATAYMRQQLAWFCQQVLEPEPPELGAELEAHLLTASWEERLQAESAEVLARLAAVDDPAAPPAWSGAERLAAAAGADDRLRAIALEQLREAGDAESLLGLLREAAASCRRYAALQAQAGGQGALREALADAHHLALEVGAEAAGALAGLPLHVVRAGLGSQTDRARAITLGLVRRRLTGEARRLAASLLHPEPLPPMDQAEFRQALLADPDPLVATEAGAAGRLDRETLAELPFFRAAPLLRPLRGAELLPLARAAAEVRAEPGAVLARGGHRLERLLLRGDGRLVGLVEGFAGAPVRRTVRLAAGQRALGIAVPEFLAICREEPKLARIIALHLAHRVWERHAPHLQGPAAAPGAPLPNRPLLPAEKALTLLDTDLFGPHGSQALLGIAEAFVTRFYPAGAPLAEAHSAPRLLVVVAGQVRTGGVVSGPGAVLGDTECLLARPWREPVTAVSPSVTVEAEHDAFQRLLYALGDLPFHLARRQARRLSLG